MWLARIVALALALVAGSASAQLRTIPADAQRGELRHVHGMLVEIDGAQERLAPGAQIRDAANRVVLPTALHSATPVRYVRDAQGQVRHVWILTPQEAAAR